MPGRRLFAPWLWPLRPARRTARRRLHAPRGAGDAAGAARRARPRAGDPGRPQRRRVDCAHPCRQRTLAAARTAYETTDLRQRLARYHADVDSAFRGWNDIWLDPAFRTWNIEDVLPGVRCPVLAIQGADDEYGTLAQIDAIEQGAAGRVERLVLPGCKHSPHRDQEPATLEAMARFIARV